MGLCDGCERPLWVLYDLARLRAEVDRDALKGRPASMWRYLELLPPSSPESIVTLGETTTPLFHAHRLGRHLGLNSLWFKDESRLPTGSFKARGMAMAITRAKELGVQSVAVPTAGNAGGAMAAYAARAGLSATVLMPTDTPEVNQREARLFGAQVYGVDGMIDDCGRMIRKAMAETGWFDLSTLKEPYRIEGKKTMGLELAEQFGWRLPDVILYPTGGGTGLIGMWKAFNELASLGWLDSSVRPRMVACQSDGCDPIVRAFEKGERHATRVDKASTQAAGIRVPAAVGDFMILDAVRESNGLAVRASESSISSWMGIAAAVEGISLCPETAICLAVLDGLIKKGVVCAEERILVINTGAAQKYVTTMPSVSRRVSVSDEGWWRNEEADSMSH